MSSSPVYSPAPKPVGQIDRLHTMKSPTCRHSQPAGINSLVSRWLILLGLAMMATPLWSAHASGAPETTDIQGSQSHGRFVLGEELPKIKDSASAAGQAQPGDGAMSGTAPASDPHDYHPMDWEKLIPANWEPLQDFKSLNFNGMSDSDPRAIAALRKLQKAWKHAPLNPDIQHEKVIISGFIVPLDSSDSTTIEEFLLVPYFGACIHVPPPPSNQVIHVVPTSPLKGFQMMDPVTVTGDLSPSRIDTPYGSAGYEMQARTVAAYEDPNELTMPAHP